MYVSENPVFTEVQLVQYASFDIRVQIIITC